MNNVHIGKPPVDMKLKLKKRGSGFSERVDPLVPVILNKDN